MYDRPGSTRRIAAVERRGGRGETQNLWTCGRASSEEKIPSCSRPWCLRAFEPVWEQGSLRGGRRKSPDTCKSRKRARITR